MSKNAYYFSHDANARNDEKILMLRADHGMEGYGIYWALLEMMFESAETCLYHDKVKGIAVSYNLDITKLIAVINTCISENLFESDDTVFWSESLRRRKNIFCTLKEKRSEGGKKAMKNRWGGNSNLNGLDNSVISELKDSNKQDITHDNKGKEIKRKENKKTVLSADVESFFEKCWDMMPNKKGKARVSNDSKSNAYKMGDIFIECIKSFNKDMKNREQQYIPHGSTFFNSGYLDYIKSTSQKTVTELVWRDRT